MWKTLKDSPPLSIMFTQNDGYEIIITDFINIWAVNFSKTDLLQRLKESNEGLELENDDLFVQKGVHMLSNPDKLRKLHSVKEDDGKALHVSMAMSFKYSFRFIFKLSQESRELYFQKVTLPLLRTIQDLHSSQNALRGLLKKKDIELDEYKCEGSIIALKHKRTEKYNDQDHMLKHKVYEENFGNSSLLMDIIKNSDKLGVPKFTNEIKPEDPNKSIVKQEPSTKKEALVGNGIIKMEPNSSIKNESETQSTTVTNNINIKQEIIKTESQDISPKKRMKKKFNY